MEVPSGGNFWFRSAVVAGGDGRTAGELDYGRPRLAPSPSALGAARSNGSMPVRSLRVRSHDTRVRRRPLATTRLDRASV